MNRLRGAYYSSEFEMAGGQIKIRHAITYFLLLFCTVINSSAFPNANQENRTSLAGKSIAFAYPVSHIVVDGDISDWPDKSIRNPIENIFGKKPQGTGDIAAWFLAGYNMEEQALYFAVIVTDDSYVINPEINTGSDTQDTYSFYIDSRNLQAGSGVVSYQFNGKWKSILNPANSWDPEVKNASWDNVVTSCRHRGSETIYEFRIILKDQIYPGRSLGVDHVITDKDADDDEGVRTYITWGDQQDKDSSPGRLGYVILMKANEAAGTVTGQLKWKDESIKGFPSGIRITSAKKPALWVQVPVDSTGKYSAILPAASYVVSPVWSFRKIGREMYRVDRKNSTVSVKVVSNSIITAPILYFSTLPAPDLIPEKGILHDFDRKKASLLDNFIKEYQAYYEIPGVSLAIIKDGKILYHKTYGVKNTYTKESVNNKTLFQAASITKTVFAFAVNSLAEKGIIDLDKPLYLYLPFPEIAYDERYKLMTARHVLSHQSGLPNWAYQNPDGKLVLKFTPGTGYGYSGEGFEYLKRVVVKITGKDIETILQEEVIRPLGLKNIFFEKDEYLAKVVANGHYENYPSRAILPGSPGMAWSMHTEALSFSSFVLALLNRLVLKPETYDEMFKIQSTVPLDEEEQKKGLKIYYGLGIGLEETPFGFEFEHGGNNGNFQCQFRMFRDLKMGYVIFTNSDTGGKLAYDDLMRFLITGKDK